MKLIIDLISKISLLIFTDCFYLNTFLLFYKIMKNTITPKQIRKNNRNLIYNFIYKMRKTSQQEIAYGLHLSRPTVASNLNDLEESGLIFKNGQIESDQIGRKAIAYSIVSDFRIGFGVEILSDRIKLISVNLYGEMIHRMETNIAFKYNDDYIRTVSQFILDFVHKEEKSKEQVLGIGIAMQGLVSPDGTTMTYAKILDCTGLSISAFKKYIADYPCNFIHDSESAAVAEMWASKDLENAFYFSISNHFGAATILNRRIFHGKHGHNSNVEHLQIDPAGRKCYCGRRGCVETVCSLDALLDGTDADTFFRMVRGGDTESVRRWTSYLIYLARVIRDMHLILDMDYIIGGYIAPYLIEDDIKFMYSQIRALTPFEENDDFIYISKMPEHNITIGAALPYIIHFLDNFK